MTLKVVLAIFSYSKNMSAAVRTVWSSFASRPLNNPSMPHFLQKKKSTDKHLRLSRGVQMLPEANDSLENNLCDSYRTDICICVLLPDISSEMCVLLYLTLLVSRYMTDLRLFRSLDWSAGCPCCPNWTQMRTTVKILSIHNSLLQFFLLALNIWMVIYQFLSNKALFFSKCLTDPKLLNNFIYKIRVLK